MMGDKQVDESLENEMEFQAIPSIPNDCNDFEREADESLENETEFQEITSIPNDYNDFEGEADEPLENDVEFVENIHNTYPKPSVIVKNPYDTTPTDKDHTVRSSNSTLLLKC